MTTFTVSARGKSFNVPMSIFLSINYHSIFTTIDSIFGFMRFTPFYGGRGFTAPQISRQDLFWMYDNNIGLRLPLSNNNFSIEMYKQELQFFKDFHRSGNIIICTNDKLADAIRTDFPLYRIEASVIKNITTQNDIDRSLKLYDSIILPMHFSNKIDALAEFKQKDRIVLFGNAGCAFNCPNKICYSYISDKLFFGSAIGANCSQQMIARPRLGFIEFDINELVRIGYHRFKLLRSVQ